jgi:hypothetical protein
MFPSTNISMVAMDVLLLGRPTSWNNHLEAMFNGWRVAFREAVPYWSVLRRSSAQNTNTGTWTAVLLLHTAHAVSALEIVVRHGHLAPRICDGHELRERLLSTCVSGWVDSPEVLAPSDHRPDQGDGPTNT